MAEGKRYYWLKLKEDFFGSKRIKKLRNMAGGDTYLVIYLKLQLKAMKTNGVIEFDHLEDNIADELALDLDENPDDIRATLCYLTSCGLAESSDDLSLFFPFAVENVGSENSSAQRVREYRERQKALHCNTSETQVKQICNGEIEIEKESENREKNIVSKDTMSFAPVIEAWNSLPDGIAKIRSILKGSNRERLLTKRIRDSSLQSVLDAIENVRNSQFLLGVNNRGWIITFDWFIKPQNFQKVLEGNYADRKSRKTEADRMKDELEEWMQEVTI